MKLETVDPTRPARHYERPRSVIRQVAGSLHRSPGGVNQEINGLHGCFRKCEDLLARLARFGAGGLDLARKQVQRFQRLVDGSPVAVTPDLLVRESKADALQDVARTEFQNAILDADPENDAGAARAFVRRCDEQVARTQELRDAVAAQWGIR